MSSSVRAPSPVSAYAAAATTDSPSFPIETSPSSSSSASAAVVPFSLNTATSAAQPDPIAAFQDAMLRTLALGLRLAQQTSAHSPTEQKALDDFVVSLEHVLAEHGTALDKEQTRIQFKPKELPEYLAAEALLSATDDLARITWQTHITTLIEFAAEIKVENNLFEGPDYKPGLSNLEAMETRFQTRYETHLEPATAMAETVAKVKRQKDACFEERKKYHKEIDELKKKKEKLLNHLNRTFFYKGQVAEPPAAPSADAIPRDQVYHQASCQLILSAQTPHEKRAIATRSHLEASVKKIVAMKLALNQTHSPMIAALGARYQALKTLKEEFDTAQSKAERELNTFKYKVSYVRDPGMLHAIGSVLSTAGSYLNPLAYIPTKKEGSTTPRTPRGSAQSADDDASINASADSADAVAGLTPVHAAAVETAATPSARAQRAFDALLDEGGREVALDEAAAAADAAALAVGIGRVSPNSI